MPYIDMRTRGMFKPISQRLVPLEATGVLNYQITCLLKDYLAVNGLCYKTLNDIVGAVECAKQEFIRRVVNPYEDKKIEENGDVY